MAKKSAIEKARGYIEESERRCTALAQQTEKSAKTGKDLLTKLKKAAEDFEKQVEGAQATLKEIHETVAAFEQEVALCTKAAEEAREAKLQAKETLDRANAAAELDACEREAASDGPPTVDTPVAEAPVETKAEEPNVVNTGAADHQPVPIPNVEPTPEPTP